MFMPAPYGRRRYQWVQGRNVLPRGAQVGTSPDVQFSPAVTTIAETIQASLSPVFMLAGIGSVLNVLAGRLSRVIDRVRGIEDKLFPAGVERDRQLWELKLLDRRMRVINLAIYLVVGAAIMTCTVVATMFVAELLHLRIGRFVAFFFIAAMLLLTAGLLAFLVEVHISLTSNRVRRELFVSAVPPAGS
jgi:hypothetical protein